MRIKALHMIYVLCICILTACADNKNLTGEQFDFACQDVQFKNPFVDIDSVIMEPIKCRYIHGGFDDGTRFSFYYPLKKRDYTNRFFQYITPFPDSETSAQAYPAEYNPIVHAIANGAYFVETNEGGTLDFNDPSGRRDASIGAYRANAACAEFSRHIAQLIYDCERPYGYCYGGSGGAYRTVGGMESTEGVWDGAVPYVLGSPHAIPNVFAARMYALRVLRDKMGDIVDALEPGGSGDPYATLNAEQREVLQEVTRMGFPIRAWYGWKNMDAHGFMVLYRSIVSMDSAYFKDDFWNKPGYLGYANPASLQRDHIQQKAVVTRIIGQREAEQLGLVAPISEEERGTADRAWASMGTDIKEKPIACEIDCEVDMVTLGGELILLSGKGKGSQLQITGAKGRYVTFASVNDQQLLSKLSVGDKVQVDNSDWLAVETFYRHQMPTEDFYVWNQFRGEDGEPIYPQRPMLLGPIFTRGAGGCLPTGKFNGKMILCCSVWDREAFAWQGDWYRNRVKEHLGDAADDNFRLWYTDRCTHGEEDDPTQVVDYYSTLYQALLDVSDWVERGIEPSPTSSYEIKDGQVILTSDGGDRGGIQPVPHATINGERSARVKVAEEVTIRVEVEVPEDTGKVVKADWCIDDSKQYTLPVDLSQATYSADGARVTFETSISYDRAGVYFPTVKVYAERRGRAQTASYVQIPNIDRVRVIVK
ncbi:MAG: hypothetical protein E7136_05610 [Rikenellaceae bacterium]|nr:hypothetical protein [Rikenellaceae bacterium]